MQILKLMIFMKVMIKLLPIDMNCLLCLRVMLWMKKLLETFFACNDRYDLKKLLAKLKEKSLNARMKHDPAFATNLYVLLIRIMNSLLIPS